MSFGASSEPRNNTSGAQASTPNHFSSSNSTCGHDQIDPNDLSKLSSPPRVTDPHRSDELETDGLPVEESAASGLSQLRAPDSALVIPSVRESEVTDFRISDSPPSTESHGCYALPIGGPGGMLIQQGHPSIRKHLPDLVAKLGLQDIVTVLHRDMYVRMGAHGIIMDVDGTVFRGTNRWMHNSLGGRNHLTLEFLIESVTKESVKLSEEKWQFFEKAIGAGQRVDAGTVVRVLNSLPAEFFGVSEKRDAEPREFLECIPRAIKIKMKEWLADPRIGPIDRVEEMMDRAYQAGLGLFICTCTDRDTLEPLFRQHFKRPALAEWLKNAIWAAIKRTESGGFSGESVAEACAAMRVEPRHAVMFGDGISDIFAAQAAGVRRFFIRPEYEDPSHAKDGAIKLLFDIKREVDKNPSLRGDMQVLVGCCYNQVVFDPPLHQREIAHFDVRQGYPPHHEICASSAADHNAYLLGLPVEQFKRELSTTRRPLTRFSSE